MTGTVLTGIQGILGLCLVVFLLHLPREKAFRHRLVSFLLAALGNLAFTTALLPSLRPPSHCSAFTVLFLLLVLLVLQYNRWCIPRLCEQAYKLLHKVLHGTTT